MLNFTFFNFQAVMCIQKSSCELNCSCISLKVLQYTLTYTLQVIYFFSGIDSTLLEIFKNVWDLSKKCMWTPEAGDHHHHRGIQCLNFSDCVPLGTCTFFHICFHTTMWHLYTFVIISDAQSCLLKCQAMYNRLVPGRSVHLSPDCQPCWQLCWACLKCHLWIWSS